MRSLHRSFFHRPEISRTKTIEEARAQAEATKMKGAAQAAVIQAIGRAEAEEMRMKAGAYKQYGDAAITALVLEALPKVRMQSIFGYLPWQIVVASLSGTQIRH
jgi:uncharacterized membrane protein YqiK